MNCTDFELDVQHRLDARQVNLTPELRAHLAACPECQAFWQGQLTLLAALKSSPPAPPPAGLLEAVLAELSRPNDSSPAVAVGPSRRHPSRGSLWGILCSTAALAILAVSLMPPTPSDEQRRTSVVKTAPSVVPDSPLTAETVIVSQTLASLWHDVRAEYAEVSEGTHRAWDDWSEFPASATLLPVLPGGATSEMEATEPDSSWLRLDRPVSERVGQAFDFLWDALPRPVPQSS
jgi:hypothetical protein